MSKWLSSVQLQDLSPIMIEFILIFLRFEPGYSYEKNSCKTEQK